MTDSVIYLIEGLSEDGVELLGVMACFKTHRACVKHLIDLGFPVNKRGNLFTECNDIWDEPMYTQYRIVNGKQKGRSVRISAHILFDFED
jgi:hypothetical protein